MKYLSKLFENNNIENIKNLLDKNKDVKVITKIFPNTQYNVVGVDLDKGTISLEDEGDVISTFEVTSDEILEILNEFNISYYGHGVNFNHPNVRSHFGEKGDNKPGVKDMGQSFYIVDNEYMSDLEAKKLINQYKHWCRINNTEPIDISTIDSEKLNSIKNIMRNEDNEDNISESTHSNSESYSSFMRKLINYLDKKRDYSYDKKIISMIPNNNYCFFLVIEQMKKIIDRSDYLEIIENVEKEKRDGTHLKNIDNPDFIDIIRKNYKEIFTDDFFEKLVNKVKFLLGYGEEAEELAKKYFNQFPGYHVREVTSTQDAFGDVDILLINSSNDRVKEKIQVKRGVVKKGKMSNIIFFNSTEVDLKLKDKIYYKKDLLKMKWTILCLTDVKNNYIYYIRKEDLKYLKINPKGFVIKFEDNKLNKDKI